MRQQLGIAPARSIDVVTKAYVDAVGGGGAGSGTPGTTAAYTNTVGDGTSTTIILSHNLNTRTVLIGVYDASTYEEVNCDKFRTSANAVSLVFATAPGMNALVAVIIAPSALSNSVNRTITTLVTPMTLGSIGDQVCLIATGGAPTLPTAVGNPYLYTIKNTTSSFITVSTTSSQTIDGGVAPISVSSLSSIDLVSDGTNWWVI